MPKVKPPQQLPTEEQVRGMRTSSLVVELSRCWHTDAAAEFDVTSAQLREYAGHLCRELDRRVPVPKGTP